MIPTSVYSVFGPIPVEQVENLSSGKEQLMGQYHGDRRLIELRENVHPTVKLQTLLHEWIHVPLIDLGLHKHVFTDKQCEVICDTISALLAGAILNGYLVLYSPMEEPDARHHKRLK